MNRIDDEIVYDSIKEDLILDVEEFLNQIKKFIRN